MSKKHKVVKLFEDAKPFKDLLVGADPEVFVFKGESPVSAHDLLPGTKYEPHKVEGGAIQVDGMAAEFNIDPADSKSKFRDAINEVYNQLEEALPKDHRLVASPVCFFPQDYMDKVPPQAKALGCDPDFSAYEMAINPAPDPHPTMRTAGGHIHIGWTQDKDPYGDIEHFELCAAVVRQLDYYIGVPSIILDPDQHRSKMYGRAGTFRPKPYGLEYRLPSNFWITSDTLIDMMYENIEKALDKLKSNNMHEKYKGAAREVIDTHDKTAALILLDDMAYIGPNLRRSFR